jgi:hypothetical protein
MSLFQQYLDEVDDYADKTPVCCFLAINLHLIKMQKRMTELEKESESFDGMTLSLL